MNAGKPRNPFVNAANKTAYYFADGMTDEEAHRALLDPKCHVAYPKEFTWFNEQLYKVVRVSLFPPGVS